MKSLIIAALTASLLASASANAQTEAFANVKAFATAKAKVSPNAKLPDLPGTTLGTQTDSGDQPVSNPENVLGLVVSPECPFPPMTYSELLLYARFNWPALYKQALGIRRAGADEVVVRDWLETNLCLAEGY